MSIAKKLTLLIFILVTFSLAGISGYIYLDVSKTIVEQSRNDILALTRSENDKISVILEKQAVQVSAVSSQYEIIKLAVNMQSGSGKEDIQKQLDAVNAELEEYAMKFDGVEHIFLADSKGIIIADNNKSLIGKDISGEVYVKPTLSGSPSISDVKTDKLTVVFTAPVKDGDKVVGFVGNEVRLNILSKYLDSVKIGNNSSGNSYIYITDSKGTLLYHPITEKIGKTEENDAVKNAAKRLSNGGKINVEVVTYFNNGADKIAAYAIIPATRWIVFVTADVNEIMAPVNKIALVILICSVIIIILALLFAFLIARNITWPIKSIVQIVDKTAKFDLTHDETFNRIKERKDETGLISRSVSFMRKSVRDMLAQMTESSETVDNNARLVEQLTGELKIQTDDTLATTQQMSAGMEEAAASTQEINAVTQDIEQSISSIANKASEGLAFALEIRKRANELKEDAVVANENAVSIYESVRQELQTSIKQSEAVKQIGALTDTIMQITEQTNLLSLNAAIEAARAGESGKGFAVVAEEVRKLAEQSSKSASDIRRIVQTVITSVDNLAMNSGKILEFIDKDVLKDYKKLMSTGTQYYDDAEFFNKAMEEFSTTARRLNKAISDMAAAVNEVSTTVNEGAKGVDSISFKTSEIVDMIDRVKASTEENTKSVEVLRQLVSKFIL